MSVKLIPSKRQHERSLKEPNGKGKWLKSASFSSINSSSNSFPGIAFIRVLCPASKIDSISGKGGEIISEICQQAGVKVKVEEPVAECDERVIVIADADKDNEVSGEDNEVGGEIVKEDAEETNPTEEGDKPDDQCDNDENKQSVPVGNLQSDKQTSSIRNALLLVFERIFEADKDMDAENEENDRSSNYVFRLILLSSQVGCLLGKGGSIVKQMSSETGAQIRILPRDKLPLCVSSSDELVQISGRLDAVRKAVQSVSHQLVENPSQDQETPSLQSGGPSSHSLGHPAQRPSYAAGPRESESEFIGRMNPPEDILTFRLLCHDEKVGGVIGKGGAIIRTLQHETGCDIKVLDGVPDSEDRIIAISGRAHPDDRISPVQDAVLRVQSRIIRAAPESKERMVVAKILVSSNQIGCLLGKGGAIIAEMRKSTGAYIRILGKDQIPKCASESEEVVQINGDVEAVQDALMQITMRLRSHFFRDAFPSGNYPNQAFLDQGPPFPPFMGRRELSPPRMYPPYHKFDAVGVLPPHGGFNPLDDRPPLMHNFHRPGIPNISERMPSARWGPQGFLEGSGPAGLADYTGAPQRRFGGFGSGNHPGIITNTTVEVVVPSSVVPAIYGEDGGCLKQIREISDAKITITEPKPGAKETIIIISGTPEQTHAAQSLIQAFVIVESEAS